MKKLIFVLTILLTLNSAMAQSRKLGPFRVDLTPVSEWMATKKGDRPMPHWKQIKFIESHGFQNGATALDVTIDGDKKKVLMLNVPAKAKSLLEQKRQIRIQLGRVTAAAAYTSAVASEARNNSSAAWSASGSAAFVNSVANEENRKQAVAARTQAVAELTEAQRQSLESKLSEIENELGAIFDLAMSTKRVIAGLELWDFGQPCQ